MKHLCFVKLALSTALLAFLAMGLVPVALASATTTTFTVTAGVGNACTVNATNMAFFTVTTTAATNATSTITVNCTLNDSYTVGLGAGNGTETARYMKGIATPANKLNYALYNNAGMTVNWGQTTGGQVAGTVAGAIKI